MEKAENGSVLSGKGPCSIFCAIHASPREFLVRTPLAPPRKMLPRLFGLKIMNLLTFFGFQPKKVFPGPNSSGFVWSGVGRALQCMQFSAIFAMPVVFATVVTP